MNSHLGMLPPLGLAPKGNKSLFFFEQNLCQIVPPGKRIQLVGCLQKNFDFRFSILLDKEFISLNFFVFRFAIGYSSHSTVGSFWNRKMCR